MKKEQIKEVKNIKELKELREYWLIKLLDKLEMHLYGDSEDIKSVCQYKTNYHKFDDMIEKIEKTQHRF